MVVRRFTMGTLKFTLLFLAEYACEIAVIAFQFCNSEALTGRHG